MSRYFVFRFREDNKSRDSLVVFCHGTIEASSLTKEIKQDVELNLSPCCVYIMGFNIDTVVATRLFKDTLFVEEVESWVGNSSEKIVFLKVTGKGNIQKVSENFDFKYSQKLLKFGAVNIFQKRKGLITSSPSYHFVKPSGAHCDKFIRASNLFTSSVEVAFLAIGLLPHFSPNLRRIYVDTSSISFLVSMASQLYSSFKEKLPLIESFESYSAFNEQYDFIEDDNSLIIISATTSGGLTSRIIKDTTFRNSNIVTLFYSAIPAEQKKLYDISGAIGSKIYSESHQNCKLCNQGSKIIKIEGEQFLPETPKHELLVIRKVDFKKPRQDFFMEFAAKDLLKFSASPSESLEKEHFYIDVKKLIGSASDKFDNTLRKKVNKHFSRDVERIICLDKTDSLVLAKRVAEIAGADPNIIESFEDIDEKTLAGSNSVVVVASAITSGRKLLATARKLRGIDKLSTITYLVAFSKLPNKDSLEQLRKDLSLGGHEVVVLRTCYLPRYIEGVLTTWDTELKLLSDFNADSFSDNFDEELPPLLKKRLSLLEDQLENNDLFLKTTQDDSLKLRDTFAFWNDLDIDTSKSTQADVYWTIQAILHDLRSHNDNGLATTYHSTLISPVCFDRYNDGVIQACLLRAAKPVELNYAIEEKFSRQITDIIISVVQNHTNPQGEACLEFLVAIWMGHLKILDKHLKEIFALKEGESDEEVKFLLNQISKMLIS